MKKLLISILLVTFVLSLSACGSNDVKKDDASPNISSSQITEVDDKESSDTTNKSDQQQTHTESSDTTNKSDQQQTHTEYVKTYFVYAEQGAEVTWFDSKTGEFKYKWKCETCGETQNGETSGNRVGEGSKLNAGFVCTNSKCSMWGKSQRAIVGCNVSGEWVEVND